MKIPQQLHDLLSDLDLSETSYFDSHSKVPFLLTKLIFTTKMQIQPEITWKHTNVKDELTIVKSQIDVESLKILASSSKVNYHSFGHPLVSILLKGLEVAKSHPDFLHQIINEILEEQKIVSKPITLQKERAKV